MSYWRVYLVVAVCTVLCLYKVSASAVDSPSGPLFRKLLHIQDPNCTDQKVKGFKIKLKINGVNFAYKYSLECVHATTSPTLKICNRASTHNGNTDDNYQITATSTESNDICCRHT